MAGQLGLRPCSIHPHAVQTPRSSSSPPLPSFLPQNIWAWQVLNAWHLYATEQTRIKNLLAGLATRLHNSRLILGFAMWKEYLDHLDRAYYLCDRTLHRMLDVYLFNGFNEWKTWMTRQKEVS